MSDAAARFVVIAAIGSAWTITVTCAACAWYRNRPEERR